MTTQVGMANRIIGKLVEPGNNGLDLSSIAMIANHLEGARIDQGKSFPYWNASSWQNTASQDT